MGHSIVPATRAMYDRTWMNREDNGGGDLLRHAPAGFAQDAWVPQQRWRGSDLLSSYGFGGFDDGGYWKGSEGGWVTTNRTWGSNPASLPAVGRATSLIADTIAGLPWRLMRERTRLELPSWLADPHNMRNDPRLGGSVVDAWSSVMWRAQLLISLLWWGDGFVYHPNRGQDGTPLPPVFILNPTDVDVLGPPRALREQRAAGIYVQGTDYRIPDADVTHLRGEGPYDEDGRGLGVLTRYAVSIGLLTTIDAYGALTYGAGVPAGYLKVNTPNISDQQADDLRTNWEARHGGPGRGVAVLNSITEFHPIAFSPVDAALIDSKRLSMLDIALAFGIDPYMLGLPGDSATYANVESRMLQFQQFTLLPWSRRVESGLDGQFPLGTALQIDMRGLLRADTATRVNAYHLALADGWMTADEVRDLEDLPPLTPAQRAAVQAQRPRPVSVLGGGQSADAQAVA